MSRLQTLPPDQRAVLQLLLQKDRSYDEIAQLLRLDGQTIRGRAHAAVASLGPETSDLSDDQRGELTDFLLGEQTASSRAATRAFLEGSPAARAWSRDAAEALRPLGGDRLPEIPSEPAAPAPAPVPPVPVAPAPEPDPEPVAPEPDPEPAPEPGSEELPPEAEADVGDTASAAPGAGGPVAAAPEVSAPARKRGSRIGGMLLAFGLAAAIAVVVILALRGISGDDDSDTAVTTTPAPAVSPPAETTPSTSTSTTSTTPTVNAEVQMRPPADGGDARATATLINQAGGEAIAIAGQRLEPTTDSAFYGLWLANSRTDAVFLGYAPQVGENGRLRLFDSLPETADPSQYEQIWLTREVVTEDTTTPTEPGRVALSGDLSG